MTRTWLIGASLVAFASACAASAGGDSDGGVYRHPFVPGYAPYQDNTCRSVGALRNEVGLETTSDLGFSGRDVVDLFNQHARGTLTWEDGQRSTQLTMQITGTSDRATSSGDAPRNRGYCVPGLYVDGVTVTVTTADGHLSDTLTGTIGASSDGRGGILAVYLSAHVAPDDLRGELRIADDLKRERDTSTLSIEVDWSPSGTVRGYCADGDILSDDPSDACNVYSGRVRYLSRAANAFEDPNYDPDTAIDLALARIELDD